MSRKCTPILAQTRSRSKDILQTHNQQNVPHFPPRPCVPQKSNPAGDLTIFPSFASGTPSPTPYLRDEEKCYERALHKRFLVIREMIKNPSRGLPRETSTNNKPRSFSKTNKSKAQAQIAVVIKRGAFQTRTLFRIRDISHPFSRLRDASKNLKSQIIIKGGRRRKKQSCRKHILKSGVVVRSVGGVEGQATSVES